MIMTNQILAIPKDWRKATLRDAVEIIDGDRGVNYPKNDEFFSDGYCLFLNTKNVPNDSFSFEETMFVDREKDLKLRKGKLVRGDFVLTTRGTVGNFAFYSENIPFDNIRINSGMVILRARDKILNKGYLNFYLKSHFFNNQVISLSSGTAQPQLPIRDLSVFQIYLPPLHEQHAIASVLSSLEDKIESLREQNKTLEATAQAVFKEWFVNFNFPGSTKELVDSELGKIPKGWAIGKLGNEIETILGGTPSTENTEYWQNGTIPWINSGKVNDFRIYEPTAYITEKALEESATKLMPKGTVVIAITGATLGQVSRLEIDSTGNQSVIGLLPNEDFPSVFIYYWMINNVSNLINTATGGAQQHINKNDVNNFDFIIPEKRVREIFFRTTNPLIEKISNNCFQIQTLLKIRDTILPKLMRGEVRVRGIDI